jgi:hypothetical protein
VEALYQHRNEQNLQKQLLGSAYKENDLIVCKPDGGIWKPESFTTLYFKFTRRVGIKLRFHDLRHRADSPIMPTSRTAPL